MLLSASPKKYLYHHSKEKHNPFSFFWTFWFFLCAIPFSFEGLSVNYLFVFTPIIYCLSGGRLLYPTSLISLFFIVCSMIFIIATIYQVQFYEFSLRRLSSFVVFISIFSLVIINFNQKMVNSFLLSVVLVGIYLSILSMLAFISSGILDPSSLKASIGTQRTGFIYLFSLWIIIGSMLMRELTTRMHIAALASIVIMFVGIVFTFSRSSYIALIGGLVFALFFYIFQRNLKAVWRKKIIYLVLIFTILLLVINILFPQFYSFLNQRLFSLVSSGAVMDNFSNSDTSEGARIRIWGEIIDFVVHNPITGSGFLGSWVLSDSSGSAHNEFIDRLLRLGFIGFSLYLLIIYKLYKFLICFHQSLAFGFITILIYGFFHETFSQSQGAVIFSFLLMLYTCHYRLKKTMRKL